MNFSIYFFFFFFQQRILSSSYLFLIHSQVKMAKKGKKNPQNKTTKPKPKQLDLKTQASWSRTDKKQGTQYLP